MATALTTVEATANADTGTLAPCAGVQATVSTFHAAEFGHFMENLEFDGHGTMWVANLGKNRIERYAPDGRQLATVPVRAPGAIRLGPDGLLYANSGDGSDDNSLPLRNAAVYQVDPETLQSKLYVDQLRVANGAAFDSAGNLYVSNSGGWGSGIVKVLPSGQVDPAWQFPVERANGVTIIGDTLYTTLTYDARSPVLRVPLDRPDQYERIAEYSADSLAKFLDDVYAGPDGNLYVAAHVTGELIRLDPATGQSCLLASGFTQFTSMRFAHDFGPYDGDIFVTEGSGAIKRVSLG